MPPKHMAYGAMTRQYLTVCAVGRFKKESDGGSGTLSVD